MNNYQLYRTNVFLGGQMQYDLVLGSKNQNLVVEDFHISPINSKVPYNKYVKDNLLNYSHQENISSYYKKIPHSFFQEFPNPKLISNDALIKNNDDEILTSYENTYEMGCRRMLYQLYNRQFNFFCPIWLEKLSKDDYLKFQFEVYTDINTKPILTKNLLLKSTNQNDYHSKFVNYFNDYLSYINIKSENGDDKLLYVTEKDNIIHGLCVKDGLLKTKNINLFNNLINREKPLMENDCIIISTFQDNKLIAKQLFNFNLCFNLSDILGYEINKIVLGKPIYINVKVSINDNVLEMRDFYSNYQNIPRICVTPKQISNIEFDQSGNVDVKLTENAQGNMNVLDYLMDYNYVQHSTKNKVVQSVIHWSLAKNNDYIFNMYPGFEGYYLNTDGSIYTINYKYNNTPDLISKIYEPNLNNIGWCNCVEIPKDENITNEKIKNIFHYYPKLIKQIGTHITVEDKIWVNNIEYKVQDVQDIIEEFKNVYILLVKDNNIFTESGQIKNMYNREGDYITIGDKDKNTECRLYIRKESEDLFYYIISMNNNWDPFVFRTFMSSLNTKLTELVDRDNIESYIQILLSLFSNKINTTGLVCFSKLTGYRADSPSLSSTEIDYFKDNSNHGKFMERYLGAIKPTFIKPNDPYMFNYLYKKLVYDKNGYESSKYYKYKDSKFQPNYPSLEYYLYDKEPLEYNDDKKIIQLQEGHWYSINKIVNLVPNLDAVINMEYNEEKGEYPKLKTLIKDYIKEYYKLDNIKLLDYIYDKYTYESDFEYDELDLKNNHHSYKYNVKLRLK